MYGEYGRLIRGNMRFQGTGELTVSYALQAPEYRLLRERYPDAGWEIEAPLQKALFMLSWVHRQVRYAGDYDNADPQDALTLLAVGAGRKKGLNCLAMSVILCECLLAAGIRARVMDMMPLDDRDMDNHVVVEAYLPGAGGWVMLDPTYGCTCAGEAGNLLNLMQLRERVAEDRPFFFPADIRYNGEKVEDLDDVRHYYAKNLFFLRCRQRQGYGEHREYRQMLEIAPEGLDVRRRMADNLQFRMEAFGAFPLLQAWKDFEERQESRYIRPEALYREG